MRTGYNNKCLMKVGDFSCTINTPKAIEDKGDGVHRLPPYAQKEVFVVDEYPACPDNWMCGSKNSSSYFVSIEENTGLWFDFNQNGFLENDVAVVISIQGINPITGQKTDKLILEQYTECPIHKKEFGQDRFCKECGFKWPKQNYLSSSSTPVGMFWLDGFRMPDGKVRQWVFTKEQIRSVAKAVIGEDRVFAIGIAFYKSKEKNQKLRRINNYSDNYDLKTKLYKKNMTWDYHNTPQLTNCDYVYGSITCSSLGAEAYAPYDDAFTSKGKQQTNKILRSSRISGQHCVNEVRSIDISEKFEVAAGAKIEQSVYDDINDLNSWEKDPSGFIYVNYASKEDVDKILNAGKRKEVSEGFLANIPTGN